MAKKDLAALRKRFDEIDDNILGLLNDRASVVLDVGRLKEGASSDFYVPSREQAIYQRLTEDNTGSFPNDGVRRVFREIQRTAVSIILSQRETIL